MIVIIYTLDGKNMSKLIYSSNLSKFKEIYPDWASTSSQVYRSVAYTGDGYLYTHGKVFQMALYGDENPWGLAVDLSGQNLSITIAGTTKSAKLPVIGVEVTDELSASNVDGVVNISHKNIFEGEQIFGPSANSDSTIIIPKLTVTPSGHIKAGQQVTATLNRVKVNSDTTSEKVYTIFGTGSSTQEVKYNPNIYANLTNGKFYATQFIQNNKTLDQIYAPISHTSSQNTYGVGSSTLYGHVKLSDSIASNSDVSGGTAATPQAVLSALNAAKTYANSILSTTDAMLFVGTLTGTGIIASYNSNVIKESITVNTTNISQLTHYEAGWTFKITSSGTISGIGVVESGDMIICIKDISGTFKTADWTIVQANIDGAVTSENLTPNTVILASGTKTIKSLPNGTQNQYLVINSSGIPEWKTVGINMRAIKYNGSDFLLSSVSTPLDLVAGSGIQLTGVSSSGSLTIKNTGVLNTFALVINNDTVKVGEYQPKTKSATINVSGGLSVSLEEDVFTISHTSSGKTKAQGLYKFSVDEYGHVTAGSAVTALPNAQALKILNNAGSLVDSYIGDTAKSIKFANGTDISLGTSTSNNIITVTPSITHKYRPISFQDYGAASSTEVFNTTNSGRLTFKAGDGMHITNSSGTLTFTAEDSWRNITAIPVSKASGAVSLGTDVLEFGGDFRCTDNGGTSVIQLGWTEIDENGTITYVV